MFFKWKNSRDRPDNGYYIVEVMKASDGFCKMNIVDNSFWKVESPYEVGNGLSVNFSVRDLIDQGNFVPMTDPVDILKEML